MNRRSLILAALILLMTSMVAGATPETEVRDALERFIAAFERGDLDAMREAFAPDAVTFPRAIMGGNISDGVDPDDYRRVSGIDPNMVRLIERRKQRGDTPPYFDIRPRDLDIRLVGDMALATFHLVGDDARLGRRTFVLQRRDGQWKILHLHASNVHPVEAAE